MNYQEYAKAYYTGKGLNCAVAILLGGSDLYGLGLTREDAKLIAGFGGGMGCGSVCGCLAGAIALLGVRYSGREDFRSLCAGFVKLFREEMGCDSIDCEALMKKYKAPECKCEATVVKAAALLEQYIGKLDAGEKA